MFHCVSNIQFSQIQLLEISFNEMKGIQLEWDAHLKYYFKKNSFTTNTFLPKRKYFMDNSAYIDNMLIKINRETGKRLCYHILG